MGLDLGIWKKMVAATATAWITAFFLFTASMLMNGCGSSGYAGASLQSLSASILTIDAGQSFSVTANDPGNLPITWTLAGTCSGASCGTLSTASGLTTTYTGPAPLTAPLLVTLQATVSGTRSSKTVAITVNPAPMISGATPNGTVGAAYSATLTTSGGTGSLKLSLTTGTLPAGLTFNAATGVISGTPTQAGTSSLTFNLVDQSDVPYTATATRQITIGTAAISLSAGGNPPAGIVGTPYTSTLQASGGTAPYTWSVAAGSLPAGLTLSSSGVISGTPTTVGSFPFTAQVQDASGARATASFTVPVSTTQTPVTITTGTLPSGTVNVPYSGTIGASGGTGPYSCAITAGSLPTGLALSAGCVVSGTPTAPGTSTVTVGVTDSGNPAGTGSGQVTITINPSGLSITAGTLPNGTVGTQYAATVGVAGGTAPYSCSVVSGSLPTGLAFGAGCTVTGTPTIAGTSTPTIRATDSSNPAASTTRPVSITISAAAATITVSSPPAGTAGAPYTGSVPVTGGTGPYTCTLTGGSLPVGLTLGSNCQITGTPTTPGTTTGTVTATDSSNPPNTGSGPISVTINPGTTTLTIGTPPAATVNTPYTGTVPVSGGTGPYTCQQAGGTLPAGLTLGSNCQITGTPTAPGTTTVTVKATDSGNPQSTNTGSVPVTVNPATVTLTFGNPPAATVNTPYTGTVPVNGGTSPYTCQQTGGTLPAGLTLGNNCQITGTPTTAGTATVTVKATDGANPSNINTGNVAVTVNPGTATLAFGTPPTATVNTPYTGTVPVSGGTGPYTCQQAGGTLPAGLTLNSNCQITGTPTTAGTTTVSVKATDSGNPASTNTGNVPVTVNPAAATLTLGTPANGMVNTPYTGTVPVSGGTAPYTCQQVGGTLPAGLTLNSNCGITGTPTTAGTTTVTVKATDAANPANTDTGNVPITINPAVTLTFGAPPTATVNTPYTGTIPVSGGTGPYTCQQVGGSLPAGLALGANCQITGTPTTPGTTTVTVKATDSSNPANSTTGNVPVTVNPAAATLTFGTPAAGTVNVPYSSTVPVSGGTAPYTCQQVGGSLPAGLSLGSKCAITGTPITAGTSTVTIKATDAANPANTNTGNIPVTINPTGATLTVGAPPTATVNVPYTGTIPVSGGTAPYTCQQTGGTLPAGLTLNSSCQITGTPTTAGTTTVTVLATDSASPANTTSANVPVTVNPAAAVTLSFGTPAAGTVNMPYSSTVPVSGGTAPYTCQQVGGTLPAGLTLNSNCGITGTPTTAGTATVTVKATDSASPSNNSTGNVPVTINPAAATLTVGMPPTATVNTPYTGTIPVSGGTGPYTCQQTGGTLPAGLTLNNSCQITGTPTTPGTTTVVVMATDSANPANTTTANVPVTVNPAAATLTLGTPAAGTVNTPYTGTVPVSGGTAPYTCQQVGGTLPAGLTLNNNCGITGTPTTAGTSTVVVKATDSANPVNTNTGNVPVTINPASVTLTVGTPPNATVNTPYTGTIPVTGGTGPYTCQQTGGSLPAGLTLNNNCQITGTPTTAGTTMVTVKTTDSANPANTTTATVPVTVDPATVVLTFGNPPAATVNTPYTGTVPVSGGTGPYTCTLAGGTLPAGLTLNSACQVIGTPTMAGSATVSVSSTDSGNPATTTTGNVVVTVNPAPITLAIGNPPTATVNTPYTGTIPVMGGTGPYTCTLTMGTLPAGLTLGAGCALSGTPTTAATTTVGITATDSAGHTNTGPSVITVQPVPTLTFTGSLPSGVVNQAYSQTLTAQGGVGPYTYALTAGALPAGLNLSQSGVISGTPTTVGASSFTVTATDSEGTPQTASLPLVLLITYPPSTSNALLKGPYAFLFQGYDDVLVGVLAYQTATIGSFTADGNGVALAGELDTNHQGSNPTGNTVPTRNFLGSYTVGTDGRGFLTTTTLNGDGTVGETATFAIALKLPTAPATASSRGAIVRYDSNQLAGTKGTGTLLAQSPAGITAGLTGSYAYGVSGDTPCLPACTVGLFAGPVAGVGQFNAAGGSITGGTADTNGAAINYPNSMLSGTYAAADSNGRVQLKLNTSDLTGTSYPTDYAVYIVDANNALLMSTDKHSAFVLQSGTARLQTQASFDNTSLGAPFVGYENSPVNPGLVGQTLQNLLNISTATVFRGTGNGNGTCTTTNVDVGGTAGLVNTLTGLGGLLNLPLLNDILGTYAATGNSVCTVSSNGRATYNFPVQLGLLGLPIFTSSPPPPRTVYLVSPNTGYFLETGYAGLGMIEAQTGQPFTPATLKGTFVYSTIPASTLATINTSGTFTADGQGHATSTLDLNVGVGTLNVLQLGLPGSANYSLTDATAGRYLLGASRVIYAIAPGRFVLLETDPLSTTPYIALLF